MLGATPAVAAILGVARLKSSNELLGSLYNDRVVPLKQIKADAAGDRLATSARTSKCGGVTKRASCWPPTRQSTGIGQTGTAVAQLDQPSADAEGDPAHDGSPCLEIDDTLDRPVQAAMHCSEGSIMDRFSATSPGLVVALTIAAAVASACAQVIATPAEAPDATTIPLAGVLALCRSNGMVHFEDRDEWPSTTDGREAIHVVRERCARNPRAFVSDGL